MKLEKYVHLGNVIAHENNSVNFVRFGIPEEEVSVKIKAQQKKIIFAQVDEVYQSSPKRIEPICRYFKTCGGCDYQHVSYQEQEHIKKEVVTAAIKNLEIGSLGVRFQFFPEQAVFYRPRVLIHYEHKKNIWGFKQIFSHEVVAIRKCYLTVPGISKVMNHLNSLTREENKQFLKVMGVKDHLILCDKKAHPRFQYFEKNIHKIPLSALKHVFIQNEVVCINPVDPEFFFIQNHSVGNGYLKKWVNEYIRDHKILSVLELFCGSHNLLESSLALDKHIGIDQSKSAILWAQKNAHPHQKFIEHNAYQFNQVLSEKKFDLLLLDPPRAGLQNLVEKMESYFFKHILLISCDLMMGIKDVKALIKKGYRLEGVWVLDLFPQTYHFETVFFLKAQI